MAATLDVMGDLERATFDIVQIDSPHQRIIRRKRIFVAFPIVFCGIIFLMVLWEIVRQNLPSETLKHWPWRLKLFDLGSGATLLTVLMVVVLTRTQYAETIRPAVGWTQRLVRGGVDYTLASRHVNKAKEFVIVNVFNGGGGSAVVVSVDYRIAFMAQAAVSEWLTHSLLYSGMDSYGLTRGKDYYFDYLRAGLPLLPGESLFDKGLVIVLVNRNVMRELRVLDVRLRFRDQVGDIHERVLDCRVVFVDEHDYDPPAENELQRSTWRDAWFNWRFVRGASRKLGNNRKREAG